ncbi:MAG: hypothetical protein GEV03_04640 [Streptosporangiales bacterium]|nr:hypothetical protein [Streptosporangiales bacterium]
MRRPDPNPLPQPEDTLERIKTIAQEIMAREVTASVANEQIEARALATGDVTGLYISARAIQSYDNETLAELVLSAVRQALTEAANAKLEAFRPIVGEPASFADALTGFSEEIAETLRPEKEESPPSRRRPY